MRANIMDLMRKADSEIKRESEITEKPERQEVKRDGETVLSDNQRRGISKSVMEAAESLRLNKGMSQPFMSGSKFNEHLVGDQLSYDFGEADVDELRAQTQGWWGRTSSGLGRLIPKVIAEVGSSAGYIAGILPAILASDMDYITNNFIVEAFQGLDEAAKEAMPVYVRNSIENGDFWESTFSSEFMANESVDALGFLVAAIGTGYGLGAVTKGIGVGTKIAEIVGRGKNFANAVETNLIAGGQTFYEAASEMRGIREELRQEFSQMEVDENGMFIMDDGRRVSPQEAEDIINTASRETLMLNGALLFLPNVIQTRMLFGTGDDLSRSVLGGLRDISTPQAIKNSISKINPFKDNIRVGVKKGLEGMGAEAFQEWSQFAIGDYQKKYSLGEIESGLFEGLVDSSINAFRDIEGLQSIFLGAVLGLGPGVVGGVRETRARQKTRVGLSELLEKNDVAFNETLQSVLKTNKDGKHILSDGKVQIDPIKLQAMLKSTEGDLMSAIAFNKALLDGDTRTAKAIISQTATKKVGAYLDIEGGMDLWNAHVNTMTHEMNPETIKQMGFNSKKEYSDFLKKIGETSSKEYAKIKDKGPSFYGIDTKHLISRHLDSSTVNEEAARFIDNVEKTAVALKVQDSLIDDQISTINNEMTDVLSSVQELEEGETIDDALKRLGKDVEYSNLEKTRDSLEELKKKNTEDYNSLFDKKQQQNAFNDRMSNVKKIKAAEEADVEKAFELDEDTKEFYDNLREKGYDVDPSKAPNVNDFGKNRVSLIDAEGNVFKILKQPNRNGGRDKFVLYDMQTKKHQPLTMDILKEKGLNTKEAILTKEEFDEWSRQKRILDANEKRLEILRGLISDHSRQQRNRRQNMRELKQELEAYQSELEEWRQLDPEMSVDSIIEEILILEDKIYLINKEIERSQSDIQSMDENLQVLRQVQSELIESMNSNIEFSFELEIKSLRDKLESGEFEMDASILQENIELTQDNIDELTIIRDSMQDALDDIYSSLLESENFIELLNDPSAEIRLKDLHALLRILEESDVPSEYNDILALKEHFGDESKLNAKEIIKLLEDTSLRKDILEALQSKVKELSTIYEIGFFEIADVNRELANVRNKLHNLKYNSKILLKYEKLNINYNALSLRNARAITRELKKNIADGSIIPNNQRKFYKNSPKEQNAKVKSDKNSAKKHTPWSTISQVWEMEWVDGKGWEHVIENGKKKLNKNWQASVTWDKTLSDIPTEDIGNFSVRFVNNAQLEELGAIAPDSRETALYAVLYKNGTNEPFSTETGIAYAGIAEPETYFKDTYATIEPERMPHYISTVRGREVSERSPIEYNGETYTSKKDLTDAILEVVKEEYIKWRAETLKNVESDVPQYAPLTSISPGQPVLERGKKNKPKDIFDIVGLVVPNSDTIISGDMEVPVAPGMVHAKLKNGRIVRLLNNKIGDLPDNVQADYLNRIIQFMALATEVRDNFNRKFTFENSTSTIPLFGTNNQKGILDYFVNWGHTQSDYGIAIYLENQKDINSQMNILITMDGNMQKIPIETLFNKNGEVRKHDDPALTVITDFLKTKYMNVNSAAINQDLPNGFYMPDRPIIRTQKDGKKVITIGKKKYKSYNDYVLDNNLYTEVIPYDPLTDKIPNFVNRYVTFGGNVPELPKIKKTPKELSKPKKQTGNFESEFKNSPIEEGGTIFSTLFSDNLPQENDSQNTSTSEGGSIFDKMFGNLPPAEAYADEMGGSPIETGVFQAAMEKKQKSKSTEKLTPAAQKSYDMLVKEYKDNPQPDNIADLEELISSFDNSPAGKAARKGAERLLAEFKAQKQAPKSTGVPTRSQVETAKENVEKSKEESKVECNTGKTGKGSVGSGGRVKKKK